MKTIKTNRLVLAAAGILLVGTGIAFNAGAALGNDPIGIVYDGIRNTAGFSPQQLGMASNFVNFVLAAVVFLMGRRYINIGTFIYILPYGAIVSLGTCRYWERPAAVCCCTRELPCLLRQISDWIRLQGWLWSFVTGLEKITEL